MSSSDSKLGRFASEPCRRIPSISALESIFRRQLPTPPTSPEPQNDPCLLGVRQSSLISIFAVYNYCMGAFLLEIPWGFSKAGFIPSIVIECSKNVRYE